MKVLSVKKIVSYIVETDESEWNTYDRSERGTWLRAYGESWEGHYNDEEIEAAYQEFMKDKPDLAINRMRYNDR